MESVEIILSEVDKLQPDQKRQFLHQLIDRMLTTTAPELTTKTNFDKYVGIGRGVWEVDAQTYINESRTDERF